MGLLNRFTATMKAKISMLLDSFEDPRETLEYSYKRQLELQQEIKRGIASVITSKKRLELQKAKLEENIKKLGDQAREAIAANRDDLAAIALERKREMMSQIETMIPQIESLQKEQDRLTDMEKKLETKIEIFRSQKEMIKAQYSAAEAKVKITEATSGIGEEMSDVGYAIQRAQDKTEDMQARSAALDEMIEKGTLEDITSSKDLVERELSRIKSDTEVKRELEELKKEVKG